MQLKRSCGLILHPTSLPGPFGIGTLGEQAFQFIEFLHSSGQSFWQVLPLGPTGCGNSPYQSPSCFAGNPLLIDPLKLVEKGFLPGTILKEIPSFSSGRTDYGGAAGFKMTILEMSYLLFSSVEKDLSKLPVIAEDLGVITPEVEELRESLGFPGMKVLQFAFGGGQWGDSLYLPHNYSPNCVVYTGTHDNDTICGWYHAAPEKTRDHVRRYLGADGSDIAWDLIRLAYSSVASLAITTRQDLLKLGTEARLNLPGTPAGNWEWRLTAGMLTQGIAGRLSDLAELYGRKAGGK